MNNPKYDIIKSMDEVSAVGHRVLHAEDKVKCSVIIDDQILRRFKSLLRSRSASHARERHRY
jgi:acetate kinase